MQTPIKFEKGHKQQSLKTLSLNIKRLSNRRKRHYQPMKKEMVGKIVLMKILIIYQLNKYRLRIIIKIHRKDSICGLKTGCLVILSNKKKNKKKMRNQKQKMKITMKKMKITMKKMIKKVMKKKKKMKKMKRQNRYKLKRSPNNSAVARNVQKLVRN